MTMNSIFTKENTTDNIDTNSTNIVSNTMIVPEQSSLKLEIEIIQSPDTIIEKKRKLSCMTEPVVASSSSSAAHNQISYRAIHRNVKQLVRSWGNVIAIHPSIFFAQLLKSRGYDSEIVPFNKTHQIAPTAKQLHDYDQLILEAVRTSNLTALQEMFESGRSMAACNQFSESIVHLACRRSTPEVVHFLLTHISSAPLYDDYGRSVLHDACWRPEPRFDIMTLLMDRGSEVLRQSDIRGAAPLEYVRKEHWVYWCAYLFYIKDKFWPIKRDVSLNIDTNVSNVDAVDDTVVVE